MTFKLQQPQPDAQAYLNCKFCGCMTPRADLTEYGARCRPCFDGYLKAHNPKWMPDRPLTLEERAAVIRRAKKIAATIGAAPIDGRAWARKLRDREESGERLSAVQRDAWRTALKFESTGVSE